MQLRQKEFKGLVGQGNNTTLKWPVAKRHSVSLGKVVPSTSDTRITFPLLSDDLFLSFANLGKNGAPSEKSILAWVNRHGLLRENETPRFEKLEKRGDPPPAEDPRRHMPEPVPIPLREFRTEVRTAYQLVTLYRDIRSRDADAVTSWYVKPPKHWPHTPPSPVDQHLSDRLEADSKEYRVDVNQAGERRRAELAATPGVNVEATYLHAGLGVLIQCVNRKLWNVRPWLEWNFWDAPPEVSASLGLERWLVCPDLLSAMYLQFYLLVTDKRPMRICANPNCRMPFLAVPKHKKFCSGGCRSTGRNYPH